MADSLASSTSPRSAEPGNVSAQRRATGGAPRVHRGGSSKAESLAVVARQLAIRSRREQGLPDHITDPGALAQGAQLVLEAQRRRRTPRTVHPP